MTEDLFDNLSATARLSLADYMDTIHIKRGEKAIEKGDVFSVYILKMGRAAMSCFNHLTCQNMSFPIYRNEILGIAETLSRSYSMMNIEAVTPCKFRTITRKNLIRLLSAEPDVCFRLAHLLSTNESESYQSLDITSF